jgi:TolB protein
MKERVGMHEAIHKVRFLLISLFIVHLSMLTEVYAKVYIDIDSPAYRKLPIAVSDFSGLSGVSIPEVIRDDLDFTGIFFCLDHNAFIEAPSSPFQQKNWSVIGAEAVVKGTVRNGRNLLVTISLYDVVDGKELFRKEYQSEPGLVRPLAHTIANDIYRQLTGQEGIFRTRIAYVVRKDGSDEIMMSDWDGMRSYKVGVKGRVILTPRWSRDGTRLLYSSERNRQWGIYILDFRKAAERNVFLSKGTNIAGDFFPNPDEVVMSSSREGSQNLYALRVSSSQLKKLTSSRGIDVSPSVSPDGNLIAFVSDRDGSPQIFMMNREGFNIRRLTFSGSYNTSPAWSPKGDKIVFSGRAGSKNQIFTMNADGSQLTQVTDRGNNEDPSFSPDGRYITFSSDRDGEKAIFIMRTDGEAQKRITQKGTKAFGPRWSPNQY